MQCMRKAAELGFPEACLALAARMYGDHPYAREVGHVGEAAGVATAAGVTEGHDVPPDVMTGVLHWLLKGGYDPFRNECTYGYLASFRKTALVGAKHCRNEGCEVEGLLKDFKVCPRCKTARYCSDACQKQDWNAGGHKTMCGKFDGTGVLRQV
jgi:hypothetical protein